MTFSSGEPKVVPVIRNWAVGVLTAPRPVPTLDRTLSSLQRAGWSDARVWRDRGLRPGEGNFCPWRERLAFLLREVPDADAYFLPEDDVVFCRELRTYLQRALWPEDPSKIALCSVFTPEAYFSDKAGWHQQNRGYYLVAAQAWIMPPVAARAVLADLASVRSPYGVDRVVGEWAAQTNRSVWYHSPSLAQHIGVGNSALGDALRSPLRSTCDFIGEDSTCDL
jgi:hypothetical protein